MKKLLILFSLIAFSSQNPYAQSTSNDRYEKSDSLAVQSKYCAFWMNSPTSSVKGFELITDQDVLIKRSNMDRDYSMGIGLNVYGSKTNYNLLLLPGARKLLDYIFLVDWKLNEYEHKISPEDGISVAKTFGIGITQSNFTPYNIAVSAIDSTDRPYASNIALNSLNIQGFSRGEQLKFDYNRKSVLSLGTTGSFSSDISEFGQTGIHAGIIAISSNKQDSMSARPIPLGWKNAISHDKNSITLSYQFNHEIGLSYIIKNDIKYLKGLGDFSIGLWANAGLTLGNVYRSFNSGLSFEMGFYKNPYGSSNGGIALHENIALSSFNSISGNIDISFIANYNYSYFWHNTFLQGNRTSRSVYVLTSEQIINNVNQLELGFKIRVLKLSGGMLWSYRSPVHVLNDNIQAWGRIFIQYDLHTKDSKTIGKNEIP